MTGSIPSDFKPSSVRAEGVALSRGGRTLVRALSFSAQAGDALVITGPNGSGKTTLLRAIGGFIQPDAGSITVKPDAPARIAWLGHADGLKPAETVGDALRFWAGLNGVAPSAVEPVMRRMAVAHLAKRPCGTLSAGQRRRTALARLALSNCGLWILDEPTAPLDARSRARLSDLVSGFRAAGGAVIATTHADLDWPDERRLDLTKASASARTPQMSAE